MACLRSRAVFQTCRRTFFRSAAYSSAKKGTDADFTDPFDHATGLEKKEFLAAAAGNYDPYYMKAIQISPDSSKDCPNLVPSVFKSRIIGCVCEPDAAHVNWMWLHEGKPRRCECGHWFKLCEKAPTM